MFKYEYVKVKNTAFFLAEFTKHRSIIDEYAEKGYRYVGFVPTVSDHNGKIYAMDLIFEKEEE